MPWSQLHYQPRVVSILRRAVENGRVAHAYLFSGPDGVGKLTAARLFAQALNCESDSSDPCGLCRSCDRLLRSIDPDEVVHPDLTHLVPGRWVGADGRRQASHTILIDAVRDLRNKLYSAPLEARHRVVIVHETDTMQVAAQNAFLKTLEEPLEQLRTVFILLSARPLNLLTTVRSRCQEIAFGFVGPDEIKRRLRLELGLDEPDAEQITALADGRVGFAVELAQEADDDKGVLAKRGKWLDWWHRALVECPGDFGAIVERLGRSRDDLILFLSILTAWHRDLLIVQAGGERKLLVNTDRLGQLQSEAERYSASEVTARMERLLSIRNGLEFYIRGDLALEVFFAETTLGDGCNL